MTTVNAPETGSAGLTEEQPAVVVGVDGSDPNRSAIEYAVEEAAATGRPLVLAAAIEHAARDAFYTMVPEGEAEWDIVSSVATRVHAEHPDLEVRRDVVAGGPVTMLLEHSAHQNLLVVGKRGLGTFRRILLGSTSTAVAGRATVPVIVVPHDWHPADHRDQPVVAGIRTRGDDSAARFAFLEAQRRGVLLRVVHALDLEQLRVWDPHLGGLNRDEWIERSLGQLEDALAPLRREFPHVRAEAVSMHGNPGDILIEEGELAQLLVMGRHKETHLTGFGLGSVTRGVLHYLDTPVAVVPTP